MRVLATFLVTWITGSAVLLGLGDFNMYMRHSDGSVMLKAQLMDAAQRSIDHCGAANE